MRFSLLFLMLFASLAADPWGKDADIAFTPRPRCPPYRPPKNIGVAISEALITFHQEVISPADGPRSHFIPSSSSYTLEAIRTYGFFKGWAMGCDRLMRENDDPWVYRKTLSPIGQVMKSDPVK